MIIFSANKRERTVDNIIHETSNFAHASCHVGRYVFSETSKANVGEVIRPYSARSNKATAKFDVVT